MGVAINPVLMPPHFSASVVGSAVATQMRKGSYQQRCKHLKCTIHYNIIVGFISYNVELESERAPPSLLMH